MSSLQKGYSILDKVRGKLHSRIKLEWRYCCEVGMADAWIVVDAQFWSFFSYFQCTIVFRKFQKSCLKWQRGMNNLRRRKKVRETWSPVKDDGETANLAYDLNFLVCFYWRYILLTFKLAQKFALKQKIAPRN